MIKHKIYFEIDNIFSDIKYEPNIAIKTNSFNNYNIINLDNYNKLMENKNKIDKYYNIKQWDKIKKIINPFELIYITNKKNRDLSISTYEPLSRSYYKMLEMSKEFLNNIILSQNPLTTCHLAEGPGGFMEALINLRKNKNDVLYGMTLINNKKEIPGWKKINNLLNKNKNIKLVNGIDNTGNLYNVDNHIFLETTIPNKCDLITGDGGFDFSIDYNLQEFLAHKLIFSQVICALSIQKINGSFICKFFDINSLISIQIIYILSIYYKHVYIFKPVTSRPANSEKYIICKEFKGISQYTLKQIRNVLKIWNYFNKKNIIINSILENMDERFIKYIIKINNIIINEQINYINKTIYLIENPYTTEEHIKNKNMQIQYATDWCSKYDIKL